MDPIFWGDFRNATWRMWGKFKPQHRTAGIWCCNLHRTNQLPYGQGHAIERGEPTSPKFFSSYGPRVYRNTSIRYRGTGSGTYTTYMYILDLIEYLKDYLLCLFFHHSVECIGIFSFRYFNPSILQVYIFLHIFSIFLRRIYYTYTPV